MIKVTYSLVATIELEDSFNWYEIQQKGLGKKFLKEVEDKVSQIQKTPNRFPNKVKNYREANLKKFPLLIIYYFDGEEIIITSIFHASRNPKRKYNS